MLKGAKHKNPGQETSTEAIIRMTQGSISAFSCTYWIHMNNSDHPTLATLFTTKITQKQMHEHTGTFTNTMQ